MGNGVNTRNSNLELYRIVCMFMIVIHHFCVHGFTLECVDYGVNKYVLDILSSWGKVGVDGFILMSSYFMVNSRFTIQKFLKIWGQVWFYTMGIFVAFYFTGNVNPIMLKLLFRQSVLPISYSMYWFVTYYLVLMILSPFLNSFVRYLKKAEYQKLLVLLILLWSVLGGFFDTDYAFSMFGWFVTLYLVAGYVRLYLSSESLQKWKFGWLSILFAGAIILSTVVRNALGYWTQNEGYWINSRDFVDQEQDFFVFAFAFCLFMYCLKRSPFCSRWINCIASLSFGVYLLHDNYFTRVYLWKVWFDVSEYEYNNWLGLWMLGVCVGVYICASIIDFVRNNTVEILWMNLIDKYVPRVERYVETRFHKE